jgi:quercetin dioxygenase-like cupin family protein
MPPSSRDSLPNRRRRRARRAAVALALVLSIRAGAGEPPASPSAAAPAPLPDPLAAGWRGAPVCERLHEDDALRVLRCAFPPGVGHERHAHPRHFGYALAGGRMRITDERGTREVELATGSSFASDGVGWHEVENVGETTVVYLLVEPR